MYPTNRIWVRSELESIKNFISIKRLVNEYVSDMVYLMQCCPVELCLVSMFDLAPITLVMLRGGVVEVGRQAAGEKRDYYRLPVPKLCLHCHGWQVPVCRLQPLFSLWIAGHISPSKGWLLPLNPSPIPGHSGPFWSFLAILVI